MRGTFAFALALASAPCLVAGPVISEFMASNVATLADEDGDFSDWVELHNPDDAAVDLTGWHLTDNAAQPLKWTLPAVTLPAGGHLLVFASGKSRAVTGAELHTNFSLKAEGEYLALTDPAGTVVHDYAPTFPPQREDRSYGTASGGGGTGWFLVPTPGAANGAETVAGFAEKVHFGAQRGFFSSPFQLTLISDTPEAEIRWTADGSTPTAAHGAVYAGPITIEQTTVLRAVAVRPGWAPSTVSTRSFFFLDDIVTQSANGAPPPGWPTSPVNSQRLDYGMDPDVVQSQPSAVKAALLAIPTLSLVTDVPNLFDATTGLYVNPDERGSSWERPVSAELMNHFAGGFQIDAGLRLRGGFSRDADNPKHSLRLHFRRSYGQGTLDYRLFTDDGPEKADGIDLATAQDYSWSYTNSDENTLLRDPWLRDSMRDIGAAHTRSFFVHVYLNGQYWGLYYTEERPEAGFGEIHFGGDKDDYDCIKSTGLSGGLQIEVTDGTMDAWQDLWQQARAHATDPTNTRYFKMQGLAPDGVTRTTDPVLLDPDALIDYLLTIYVSGCFDAPVTFVTENRNPNNFFMLRNRNGTEGWRYFVHDGEQSLIGPGEDRTGPFITGNQNFIQYSNPQFLHQDLIGNAEYRLRWADRVQKHLRGNGLFTREQCQSRLDRRAAELAPAILAESARWGDAQRPQPYGVADWESARDGARGFFDSRIPIVLAQLREDGLFPDVEGPEVSPAGGSVASGANFTLSTTAGQIHYTLDGSDPRLPGGAVAPTAVAYAGGVIQQIPLVPQGTTWRYLDDGSNPPEEWKSGAFDDSAWKTGQAEFGYGDGDEVTVVEDNPTPGFSFGATDRWLAHHFRRTFHVDDPADFIGATLRVRFDDGVAVYLNGEEIFRENMPPGDLNWVTPATSAKVGDQETTFSTLEIPASMLHAGDNLIAAEVHQASTASNDMSFDLSLVARELEVGPAVALTGPAIVRVKTRSVAAGEWSPLQEATFVVDADAASAGNLLVSEIHFSPAGSREEGFIELMNVGPRAVDLRGVRIDGDVRFVFPEDTPLLLPGQRLVLVENAEAFATQHATAVAGTYTGKLSATDGSLTLLTPALGLIETASFDSTGAWPLQTVTEGYSLVRVRPLDRPHGGLSSSWRLSTEPGGNPGTGDDTTFAEWKAENGIASDADDADGDGLAALAEYALNGDPTVPAADDWPTVTPPATEGAAWTLSAVLRAGADDLLILPQLSSDLGQWDTAPGSAPVTEPLGNGRVRQTWSLSPPGGAKAFWRLHVSLRE